MNWDKASGRILLAVTGLSCQVVTETIYALAQQDRNMLPDAVYVLTTREGAERARLLLCQEGWFGRLLRDWELPSIAFGPEHIQIIHDARERPLGDIRSQQDNVSAADTIAEAVRTLTTSNTKQLHVSIAGGRKTMGFFAGYALTLYGRPQDRLSHVLVSSEFESHPDFYYPTPYPRVIHTAWLVGLPWTAGRRGGARHSEGRIYFRRRPRKHRGPPHGTAGAAYTHATYPRRSAKRRPGVGALSTGPASRGRPAHCPRPTKPLLRTGPAGAKP